MLHWHDDDKRHDQVIGKHPAKTKSRFRPVIRKLQERTTPSSCRTHIAIREWVSSASAAGPASFPSARKR